MSPLSGVLGEAWTYYKRYAAHFLLIAFVIYVAAGIIAALLGLAGSIGLFLGWIVSVVAAFLVQAALVKAVQDVRDGQVNLNLGETVSAVLPFLGTVIIASILAGIGIAIGLALIIVPGLILLTFWSLIVPSIVIGGEGVFGSFRKSWRTVRGYAWHVFGTYVLVFLILIVFDIVIGLILLPLHSLAARNAISSIVSGTLVAPFLALVVTLIYYRLTAAHEARGGPGEAPRPPGPMPRTGGRAPRPPGRAPRTRARAPRTRSRVPSRPARTGRIRGRTCRPPGSGPGPRPGRASRPRNPAASVTPAAPARPDAGRAGAARVAGARASGQPLILEHLQRLLRGGPGHAVLLGQPGDRRQRVTRPELAGLGPGAQAVGDHGRASPSSMRNGAGGAGAAFGRPWSSAARRQQCPKFESGGQAKHGGCSCLATLISPIRTGEPWPGAVRYRPGGKLD